nr:MAG TPA: hypothetical protein [Caudoviricetes sp.]
MDTREAPLSNTIAGSIAAPVELCERSAVQATMLVR